MTYEVKFHSFSLITGQRLYGVYQDCQDDGMPPDPFEIDFHRGYPGYCLVVGKNGLPLLSSNAAKVQAVAALLGLPDTAPDA